MVRYAVANSPYLLRLITFLCVPICNIPKNQISRDNKRLVKIFYLYNDKSLTLGRDNSESELQNLKL